MSGQRAAATANYKDMRADTKRAQDQLTWIPAHRPPETVSAELNVHKAQRFWLVTNECTDVKGKSAREYCQQFHKLNAELASGVEAQKLETRITDIGTKLARAAGGSVMAEADPQASVLAKVTGVEIETVQTGLALLVALLIEIGSGFGMYVAFAYWRMHGHEPQAVAVSASTANVAPLRTADRTLALPPAEAVEVEEPAALPAPAQPPATARLGANDNRTPAKRLLPDSDVQRFYREEVLATDGMSITLNDLYNSYCNWSEDQEKEPLAMPTFSREFRALGVRKEKIGGRVRYFDIALRSEQEAASEDKLAASKAA